MSDTDNPNVLLVTADDQRFDMVGALGDGSVRTPNLDRLVREGCAFTRAHNMGSTHGAVCVPARSMIHSGQSLFHLDGPGGMTEAHPTLPEAFGNAGYRTFGTGKWHNGQEAFNRCYDEGRNIFFGGMHHHWNVPVCDRYPLVEYPAPRPHRFSVGGDGRKVQPSEEIYDRFSSGTHSSELFGETTVEFIRDHARSSDDRPFFAYNAFMAPHDPRTAPGKYHAMYGHDEIELPENFMEEHPFDNGHLRTRDEVLAGHPRDPDVIRRHIADYYAMITHLDAQVGRMIETLAQTNQLADTIVVFTADHGLAVGQHGLLGKQNIYEHSVRVPLIFCGPGIPSATRRSQFSYQYDLYPTLAEFAGIDVPDTVEGHSLGEVITDDAPGPRDSVFTAFGETQRGVRTDQFKLIEYFVEGDRRTQLFDLAADPGETTNLVDDPGYANELAELRERLADWRERVDDPQLAE